MTDNNVIEFKKPDKPDKPDKQEYDFESIIKENELNKKRMRTRTDKSNRSVIRSYRLKKP
jgi:hypothetical protein